MIAIMICGVIGGCNNFEEVEVFGQAHIFWTKQTNQHTHVNHTTFGGGELIMTSPQSPSK